jgi:hypothetical protein
MNENELATLEVIVMVNFSLFIFLLRHLIDTLAPSVNWMLFIISIKFMG